MSDKPMTYTEFFDAAKRGLEQGDCLPLPALTLGEVASLFDAHPVTVARWRSSKNGLPEPDFVPAGNPKRALWAVATIVEWAESRGKEIDREQLARIVSGDGLN